MSAAPEDPEALRGRLLDGWDEAARGWRRAAAGVRDFGLPVSAWLVEHLELAPGERVLELAAGPGDTGFMAADAVRQPDDGGAAGSGEAARPAGGVPPGTLISSDGSEKMLEIARDRARERGIENVEFRQLQLEWIDLETASVDAIVCRWGVMLLVDPAAALTECRRVLRPGGRMTLAVWDAVEANPWAAIPSGAVQALGFAPPPDPAVPGPFSLAAPGRLPELLADAGFLDVHLETVAIERRYEDFESFLDDTLDLSHLFATAWTKLADAEQAALMAELQLRLAPFTAKDGSIAVPGRTFVARADA